MVKARLEKIFTHETQGAWWLELNGSIDPEKFQLPSAIESNAILNRLIETHAQKLIIDFTTLTEFDSRGIQLLLMLYKQFISDNIHIVLRNPNSYLSRVLRIMQIDQVFEIEFDDYYQGLENND